MREECEKMAKLDILCIGQIQAGKSYFLREYTKDEVKQMLHNTYEIYARKVEDKLIYFHQLSQEEDLYLQKQYDGILFFVDLVGTWNVVENILKWMELQSRLTGTNIYKIPLRVIITKTRTQNNDEKWKKCLEKDLSTLVQPDQIVYFESIDTIEGLLSAYFQQILEGRAAGIKSTNEIHFRLYGLSQIFKFFIVNVKLTFFRCSQVFEKNVRRRVNFLAKTKIN